ncbi:polysaccharide deacetylase family protein [Actinomycetospora lemnae]|uniref:Polysaccharide deacetylase family protein n=1 Tax=Actinomycetospora lemnae TaxID=3019891 RepID=A0ABT5SZE4_9PSEU|nr:polysaccharide deacetylase family protein [Actinomycetospora sp. DW7H6]MDD7968227.1 polysaccharide deacetylase family protein [Actinomycetospora sp. DW7H6]
MLTPRQRVILRQIVSPPYIYRWAGLLTTIALMTGVTVVVLSDVGARQVLATGPAPAVTASSATGGRPARLADDAPARGMPGFARPAITSSLLTVTDTGTDHPAVALTFDDGPTPEYTPQVLDLLAQYGAKATFCMIGDQALAHPEIVQRVINEGHRLCDHTMTHDATVGSNAQDLMSQQLQRSRTSLSEVVAPPATIDYFRAPEGRWTPLLDEVAAQTGMRPLGWSVDTLDWTQPGSGAIVGSVQQGVHPGAVVLFHDGGGPREQTIEAVRELLPWLQEQGYQFVMPS